MCFFPIQWHCLLISIWKENSTSSNLFVRVLWLDLPPNLVLSFQFYLMIGKQNECSNKQVQTGFLHRWVVTSSADTDLGDCDSIPLSTETIRHGQDLLQQSNPSYCFFYRYSFAHLWLTVVSLVFYIGDSNLMPAYTIMTHGQSNQYPSLQFHSSLSRCLIESPEHISATLLSSCGPGFLHVDLVFFSQTLSCLFSEFTFYSAFNNIMIPKN